MTTPPAEDVIERMPGGAIAQAPVLWLYEAVAVIAKAQRTGGVSREDANGFIEDLRSLEIAFDYAAYLELAIRKGLPLTKKCGARRLRLEVVSSARNTSRRRAEGANWVRSL